MKYNECVEYFNDDNISVKRLGIIEAMV